MSGNRIDPAAMAVAESVYDTFPLPLKGAKDCAAKEVERYGDQRAAQSSDRIAELEAALRACAEAPFSGWTIAQALAHAALNPSARSK